MTTTKRIALVICSPRTRRLGPYIATHVHDLINALPQDGLTIETIDLAALKLPVFDGAAVPASLPKTDTHTHYPSPAIQAWSRTVASYDAFAFVTPEYNAGLPAAAKNALDHLYHEWTGKPLGIVAYGVEAGKSVAAALRLSAGKVLRMRALETQVNIQFAGGLLDKSVEEGRVPEESVRAWKEEGVDEKVAAMWKEMRQALELDPVE